MISSDTQQLTLAQAGAFEMTAEQASVWNLLKDHKGKAGAVKSKTLATASGLPERRVREIVTSLILVFHIRIGSAYSGRHPGWFVIESSEEAEETYQVLRGHALSILKRAAVIRRLSFPELVGQLMITEEKNR